MKGQIGRRQFLPPCDGLLLEESVVASWNCVVIDKNLPVDSI